MKGFWVVCVCMGVCVFSVVQPVAEPRAETDGCKGNPAFHHCGLPVKHECARWGVNRWERLRRGIATPVWEICKPPRPPGFCQLELVTQCVFVKRKE